MSLQNNSTTPKKARIGVLLSNLGTPDAATPRAVRRYLAEFLSDPRIIELPRWLWLPALYAVVLNVRPFRSTQAYERIWTTAGSPLMFNMQRLAVSVSDALDRALGFEVPLALGMRYGNPSIPQALAELSDKGAERIIVLPLYPQYSGTTTASTLDAVARALGSVRVVPELRFINGYHDAPGFIDAVARSIEDYWKENEPGELLLFSFHGIPERCVEAGDPYEEQCQQTAQLITRRLGLDEHRWRLSFQSRVGREPWLQPYTDVVVEELAKDGVQSVDVVCPGFSVDCLETLEEIALGERERFENAGGKRLAYIPALNDRIEHVRFIADLIQAHAASGVAAR
ncbi:MAG: ferrochelatase [Gammaproteobacteria bacterium]